MTWRADARPATSTSRRSASPAKPPPEVLSTGWLVAVDGRLEYHEWEQDGKTRHDYEVIGSVEFLAAPRRGAETSESEQPVEAAA